MNKILALLFLPLVLCLGQPALADHDFGFFYGQWGIDGGCVPSPTQFCAVDCGLPPDHSWYDDPSRRGKGPLCCPTSSTHEECRIAAGEIPGPVTQPPDPPDPPVTQKPDPPDPPVTERPDPPDPPVTTNPRPTTPTSGGGGGGGSSGGGAVLAGGAALLVFHFANHWTDNWSQEFLPEGLEVKPRANVVYRDGWSGAFAGLTATYGDWTMNASSRHSGEGWSGPDARLDWRALDYAGWVVNASGSYSGGQWAKPYAKIEWSWRF